MRATATEVKPGMTIADGDFDELIDILARAEKAFRELADALISGHLSKSGAVPRDETMWLMLLAGGGVGLLQKARTTIERGAGG